MAENTTEEGGGCCVGVGYRFHPNDEEIINYFLKHKMDGFDSLVDDDVRQIDLCQYDPWEIPSQGIDDDDEWYFFCARPRDYFEAAGLRRRRKLVSRKTKSGYWKLDGEDRRVKVKGVEVGTKRTLVFQMGRGSVVERTKWIIHEYKPKTVLPHQTPFVLCKLMRQEEKKKLNKKKKKKGISSKDTSSCDELESSYPIPFDLENPPVEVPIPEVDSDVFPVSVNAANELDFRYPSTFQPEIHATQDTTLETNDFEEDPIKLADSFLVDPDESKLDFIGMISLVPQLENMRVTDTDTSNHDSVRTLGNRKLRCINRIERNRRSILSDTRAECVAREVEKHDAAVGQSQKESTDNFSEEDLRIAFTKLELSRKCNRRRDKVRMFYPLRDTSFRP